MICSRTPKTDSGAEGDEPQKIEHVPEEAEHGNKTKSGNIITVLANAGQSLEGDDAELVLNPLRLAFETKNLKILDPALDCLHVSAAFTYYYELLLNVFSVVIHMCAYQIESHFA